MLNSCGHGCEICDLFVVVVRLGVIQDDVSHIRHKSHLMSTLLTRSFDLG